ncbi:glycine-rich domain-containing protein [Acinetobacter shaoyimingii]|uniref:hypothetical protein n=1 Tax=Acinetobacter shaoyimingii TaxID=2715164 RepID=UPI001D0E8E36|nr:hypothetical protein [Acinetobacter shaoyimingii]
MMMVSGIAIAYFFSIYLLVLFVAVVFVFWSMCRVKSNNKFRKLDQLRIPEFIKTRYLALYPEIEESKFNVIEEGFKDFLGMHLRYKTAYVMPSYAVDALWHLLIDEFNPYYQQLCISTLGYVLSHKAHEKHPTQAQITLYQAQWMQTWKSACLLEQQDPERTCQLPRIFRIDQNVKWKTAQAYELKKLKQNYMKWKNKQLTDLSSTPITFVESTSIGSFSSSSTTDVDTRLHDSNDSHISDSSNSCGSCSSGSD